MYKNRIDTVLTAIFSLIILFCVILITKDIINYKKAGREYDRLKKYISDETEIMKADNTDEVKAKEETTEEITDFEKLYEINQDLVCILSIPSLDLMYPVVQSTDNVKYLNTTFEGNRNPAGCLFIDYENSRDMTDANTYIYGHNMKNGSMFGSLKQIINDGSKRKDTKAYITTGDTEYTYSLEEAEVVNIDEYKPPQDKTGLLTLYTCWGNDKSRRLLVTFSREV
ncbi:MAG: class B sortase [Lachnospiraceae bacterium]|nr:class B sortase [Lachnospiraceae bacterium]